MSDLDKNICLSNLSLEPAVYLLPVTMSDCDPNAVLPTHNLEILCKIKYFFVENVRTARRFLKKVNKSININALHLVELSEHTRPDELPAMLTPLKEGHAIGIMSEAGCPGVADPGAKLVELAQQQSLKVIPLVGPSSILLALMASGLNGQNFAFNGYLPIDDKARIVALRSLAGEVSRKNVTQIFIETPYRNNRLIGTILATLPSGLKLCIASDITGVNERIETRTLADWKKRVYNYDKIPTIFLLGQ